jgi:hypothetical protein
LFFFDGGGLWTNTMRVLKLPNATDKSRCSKDLKVMSVYLVILRLYRKNTAEPPPLPVNLGASKTVKSLIVFRTSAADENFVFLLLQLI